MIVTSKQMPDSCTVKNYAVITNQHSTSSIRTKAENIHIQHVKLLHLCHSPREKLLEKKAKK